MPDSNFFITISVSSLLAQIAFFEKDDLVSTDNGTARGKHTPSQFQQPLPLSMTSTI